jgi:hypothetical protein
MLKLVRNAKDYLQKKIEVFALRAGNGKIIQRTPSNNEKVILPKCIDTSIKIEIMNNFVFDVMSLPTLYEIWYSKNKPKMTVEDKIFNSNYDYITLDGPTIKNIITPNGFCSPVRKVYFFASKFIISLVRMNTVTAISAEETNLSLNILISFLDPEMRSGVLYRNLVFSDEVERYDFSDKYDVEINLNDEEKALFAMYNQWIIYISVATKTADYRVVQYSRTYSKKYELTGAVRLQEDESSDEKIRRLVESLFEPSEQNEILDSIYRIPGITRPKEK